MLLSIIYLGIITVDFDSFTVFFWQLICCLKQRGWDKWSNEGLQEIWQGHWGCVIIATPPMSYTFCNSTWIFHLTIQGSMCPLFSFFGFEYFTLQWTHKYASFPSPCNIYEAHHNIFICHTTPSESDFIWCILLARAHIRYSSCETPPDNIVLTFYLLVMTVMSDFHARNYP